MSLVLNLVPLASQLSTVPSSNVSTSGCLRLVLHCMNTAIKCCRSAFFSRPRTYVLAQSRAIRIKKRSVHACCHDIIEVACFVSHSCPQTFFSPSLFTIFPCCGFTQDTLLAHCFKDEVLAPRGCSCGHFLRTSRIFTTPCIGAGAVCCESSCIDRSEATPLC